MNSRGLSFEKGRGLLIAIIAVVSCEYSSRK